LLTADEPSLEKLKDALVTAEDDLVTGNPQVAATRLFRIVESPRWNVLAFAPEFRTRSTRWGGLSAWGVRVGKRYLCACWRAGVGSPTSRGLSREWSTSLWRRAMRPEFWRS